jgi:hypothetical protein
MTSLRQIEANRRNALKSTGPKSEMGKQQSSQNAVRHGLTAETVIKLFEDSDDYHAFELAVTSGYEAVTAVERELVLRLASLLWRLRRATSIETGLMQIQGEALREERGMRGSEESVLHEARLEAGVNTRADTFCEPQSNQYHEAGPDCFFNEPRDIHVAIAQSFLRLASIDNGVFERLGRYETALWRQVRQTIITLEVLRWQTSSRRGPPPTSYRSYAAE